MGGEIGARPPRALEKIVRLLVPPASREHVTGDLSERYQSPGKYLLEALSVLPFVVASQVRRTSSLPRVVFRAFVLWFGTFFGHTQRNWLVATLPALLATVALVLRDAYRPVTPPRPAPVRPRDAAFDVALVCACALLTEAAAVLWAPELLLSRLALTVGLPFGCVVLFILRLQNPGGGIWATPAARAMSLAELITEVRGFEAVWRRAMRIEFGAGLAVAAGSVAFVWLAPGLIGTLSWLLTATGALFATWYLHKHVRLAPVPEGLGFAATLDCYRRNLQWRIARTRRYLWWYLLPLALGPAVLAFGSLLRQPNPAPMAIRTLAIFIAIGALILLLNRTSVLKFKQRIDQLETITEKQ